MYQFSKHVGLDTHAETIAVAVADACGGEARYYGEIANRPAAVAKLVSQPRARAEPCRHLARRERVRRLRLSPTQRKWRLCEAGCWLPGCRASGVARTCPR
mgnify:CR=1 FL=1